jgi:hypothetical protein
MKIININKEIINNWSFMIPEVPSVDVVCLDLRAAAGSIAAGSTTAGVPSVVVRPAGIALQL